MILWTDDLSERVAKDTTLRELTWREMGAAAVVWFVSLFFRLR